VFSEGQHLQEQLGKFGICWPGLAQVGQVSLDTQNFNEIFELFLIFFFENSYGKNLFFRSQNFPQIVNHHLQSNTPETL